MLFSFGPKVRALSTALLIALLPVAGAAADLTALRTAANQGDKDAMRQLGEILSEGGKQEQIEAASWGIALAWAGDLDAQLGVARAYTHGEAELDLEADLTKAEKFYYLALKQTDEALPEVINFYNEQNPPGPKHHQFALDRLMALANQGQPLAQYLAAQTYAAGFLVAKDKAAARAWLGKSAAQGFADAQVSVALSLTQGHGVERDETAGLQQLAELASAGNVKAQLYSAMFYQGGTTVKADPVLAAKYFKMAADAGSTQGEFEYAKLLQAGEGVAKDEAAALKIWEKYADQSGEAAYFAGSAYATLGSKLTDYKKAAAYFRLAINLGYAGAEDALAMAEHMTPIKYERNDDLSLMAGDAIKDGTGRYFQIYSYRGSHGDTIKARVHGRGVGTFNSSRTSVTHLRLFVDDGSGKFKPVTGLEQSVRLAKDGRIQFMISTQEPNQDGQAVIEFTTTRVTAVGAPPPITRHEGSDHQLAHGHWDIRTIVAAEAGKPVKARVTSSAFTPALAAGEATPSAANFVAAIAINADRGRDAELQYTARGERISFKVSPVYEGAGGPYRLYVDQTLSWQKARQY